MFGVKKPGSLSARMSFAFKTAVFLELEQVLQCFSGGCWLLCLFQCTRLTPLLFYLESGQLCVMLLLSTVYTPYIFVGQIRN